MPLTCGGTFSEQMSTRKPALELCDDEFILASDFFMPLFATALGRSTWVALTRHMLSVVVVVH